MRMYDIIEKKKNKEKLSNEEISFVVKGFTNGDIPDYQMASLLMAICLNKMDKEETLALTLEMAHSGEMLNLSAIDGIKVDKHSTGGVGDKTSLVIAPMVASLSIPVAKMSGRGLGHTGGTIDKLECFPGFSTAMSPERFFENVNKIKLAIAAQTANLAPADKKIYALRDVTATVGNVSLIASSVMSKKLASGSDVIVLDVKTGSGAFMKNLDDAIELAKTMVEIGNGAGRKTYALVTDMNQPLGNTVGNSLEVIEAINTLKGNGPDDLMEDALALGSYMVYGAGKASSPEEARALLLNTISDGSALNKLAEFVDAQGGDSSYVYDTDKFIKANFSEDVNVDSDGFITEIKTDEIGIASLLLGGGRETKESIIDPSVGIKIHKKIGAEVKKGTCIATIYGNDIEKIRLAKERIINAYTISQAKPEYIPKPVYAIVTEKGTTLV